MMLTLLLSDSFFFCFVYTATPEIYPYCHPLSLPAALPISVRLRPPEARHVDVLAGHRADHVRAGDEDAALRAEDHDVGQGRTIGGSARGRAEHDGDLRDPARRLGHDVEDLTHGVQGEESLGQAGAAGMPAPDDPALALNLTAVGDQSEARQVRE